MSLIETSSRRAICVSTLSMLLNTPVELCLGFDQADYV